MQRGEQAPTGGVLRSATSRSARESLLDVAESLLATEGLPALTIRAVTQAAGVNLATVNYVFGSKDGLLIGLQQRMLQPMTQERLDRFDALEAAGPVSLDAAVRALLEPLAAMREAHGRPTVELYRYFLARPDARVAAATWDMIEPGLRRFETIVLTALPHAPREPLLRGVHLVCQLAIPVVLRALDTFELTATEDLDELVEFVAGGLESVGAATYAG